MYQQSHQDALRECLSPAEGNALDHLMHLTLIPQLPSPCPTPSPPMLGVECQYSGKHSLLSLLRHHPYAPTVSTNDQSVTASNTLASSTPLRKAMVNNNPSPKQQFSALEASKTTDLSPARQRHIINTRPIGAITNGTTNNLGEVFSEKHIEFVTVDPSTFQSDRPYAYRNQSKPKRFRATKDQSHFLLNAFSTDPSPDSATRSLIAATIGMPVRTIQVWFQNRRSKMRSMERKTSTDSSNFASILNTTKANSATFYSKPLTVNGSTMDSMPVPDSINHINPRASSNTGHYKQYEFSKPTSPTKHNGQPSIDISKPLALHTLNTNSPSIFEALYSETPPQTAVANDNTSHPSLGLFGTMPALPNTMTFDNAFQPTPLQQKPAQQSFIGSLDHLQNTANVSSFMPQIMTGSSIDMGLLNSSSLDQETLSNHINLQLANSNTPSSLSVCNASLSSTIAMPDLFSPFHTATNNMFNSNFTNLVQQQSLQQAIMDQMSANVAPSFPVSNVASMTPTMNTQLYQPQLHMQLMQDQSLSLALAGADNLSNSILSSGFGNSGPMNSTFDQSLGLRQS
ncbi:hypothetical protein BDV3_006665 [Batrachochytrium dendrobatidis]